MMKTFNKFKHLQIAQEAIAFQDGKFHESMTQLFEQYLTRQITKKDLQKDLPGIVKKYLNITISVEDSNGGSFYTYIPWLSANNAVWPQEYKPYIDVTDDVRTIKKLTDRKGIVDLKNSKLEGIFATAFVPLLYLDFIYINQKRLTAEELSAICLHEFGHYFTACEMLDRTVTTNIILQLVDKSVRNEPDMHKREMVIEVAGKHMDLSDSVIADLKKSSSDTAITTVFVAKAAGQIRSENGNNYYDMMTMEFLCDQFATRHGAGKELVSALDKLTRDYTPEVFYTGLKQTIVDILRLALDICLIVLSIIVMSANPFTSVCGIFLGILLIYSLFADSSEVHNDPKDRLLRIKFDLTTLAKKRNSSTAAEKQLIEDIKFVDGVIEEYKTGRSLFEKIGDFIFGRRDDKAVMNFQRQLEQLAMNDLFVKSLELKHSIA